MRPIRYAVPFLAAALVTLASTAATPRPTTSPGTTYTARFTSQVLTKDGTLRAVCKAQVMQCASRSTCGRPGWVTCCRTDVRLRSSCSTKRNASRCRPPSAGRACVGTTVSCCDACNPDGTCTR